MKTPSFKTAMKAVAVTCCCAFYSAATFAGSVAIVTGPWYTPNLKTKMEAAGHTVTEIATYTTGDLDSYDAIIQDGNSHVDTDALRDFATNGGNVILIPWTSNNWSVPADLQVMENASCPIYDMPYPGVDVLDAGHSLLAGVTFPDAGGFDIGRVCGIGFIAEATETIAEWGDGNSAFLGTRAVGSGQVIHLNMHLITSDTAYLVIEQDWAITLVSNMIDGGAAETGTARFNVTKTFSDLSTDEVEVTITCNAGLPLQQSFTIAGGDPAGVTFSLTSIPDGGADCEITESGTPDEYTPIMNGGDGCSFENVTGGFHSCHILNEADNGTFTVNMDWNLDSDNGEIVDTDVPVTIWCDAEIVPGSLDQESGDWFYETVISDGGYDMVAVDTATGPASCWATQTISQSGVESMDDCSPQSVGAAEAVSCTFSNTMFFEGIPTLSQYGLAVLILLTLGVGMVGFRRMV